MQIGKSSFGNKRWKNNPWAKIFLGGCTLFLFFWKGAWSPLCEASKGVHNLNDGYDINHQFRVE